MIANALHADLGPILMFAPRTMEEIKDDIRSRVGKRAPFIHADKGEAEEALAKLEEANALDPGNEDAALTRIETLLALSRHAEANAALAQLSAPERARPIDDERRLAALGARAAFAADAGADLSELANRTAANPADCDAKLAYARALAARGDYERALEHLLAIVHLDRGFGDDVARKTMLMVFEALPVDSELVRRYRRALASALN
jgi:putative thioredoxin